MYTVLRCAQDIAEPQVGYTSLLGVYQSKSLSSIGLSGWALLSNVLMRRRNTMV